MAHQTRDFTSGYKVKEGLALVGVFLEGTTLTWWKGTLMHNYFYFYFKKQKKTASYEKEDEIHVSHFMLGFNS
jgi:hypothetical protein